MNIQLLGFILSALAGTGALNCLGILGNIIAIIGWFIVFYKYFKK